MKNKLKEMTFLEFFEEAKREGIESEVLENMKRDLLKTLKEDGFTEKQINETKWEKSSIFS